MRTTLDIEDDILLAVKSLARRRGVSAGKVMSELVRSALTRRGSPQTRNGVPLFSAGSGASVVTMELVNQLRDEES